jgi:hypothetical protein
MHVPVFGFECSCSVLDEWAVEYGNGFRTFLKFICKDGCRGTPGRRAVARTPRNTTQARPAAVRASAIRTRFGQVFYNCYMTKDIGLRPPKGGASSILDDCFVYTTSPVPQYFAQGERREHGAARHRRDH